MKSYEEIIEDIREDIRNNRFGDAFEKAKEIFKKTTSDDLKEKFDILCSDYNISEEDSAPFPGVKNGIRKRFFLYLTQLEYDLGDEKDSNREREKRFMADVEKEEGVNNHKQKRMQKKLDSLQEIWEEENDALKELKKVLARTPDGMAKIQLKKQIEQKEKEMEGIEGDMDDLTGELG